MRLIRGTSELQSLQALFLASAIGPPFGATPAFEPVGRGWFLPFPFAGAPGHPQP